MKTNLKNTKSFKIRCSLVLFIAMFYFVLQGCSNASNKKDDPVLIPDYSRYAGEYVISKYRPETEYISTRYINEQSYIIGSRQIEYVLQFYNSGVSCYYSVMENKETGFIHRSTNGVMNPFSETDFEYAVNVDHYYGGYIASPSVFNGLFEKKDNTIVAQIRVGNGGLNDRDDIFKFTGEYTDARGTYKEYKYEKSVSIETFQELKITLAPNGTGETNLMINGEKYDHEWQKYFIRYKVKKGNLLAINFFTYYPDMELYIFDEIASTTYVLCESGELIFDQVIQNEYSGIINGEYYSGFNGFMYLCSKVLLDGNWEKSLDKVIFQKQ